MKTYRALVESLCAAIQEEIIQTGSIDDVPPSAQARYDAMERALTTPAIEEAAFRVYIRSYVLFVEIAFKAHRGCPVRLFGELGTVYWDAIQVLAHDGRYPVIRSRYTKKLGYADLVKPHPELPPDMPSVPKHVAYRSRQVAHIADQYLRYDLTYFAVAGLRGGRLQQ